MMNSSEWHASKIAKRLRLRRASMNPQSSGSTVPVKLQASHSSLTPPTGPRLTKFQKVVLGLALIVSAVLLTLSVVLHVNDTSLSPARLRQASHVLASTLTLSTWTIPPTMTSVLSGMVNNV